MHQLPGFADIVAELQPQECVGMAAWWQAALCIHCAVGVDHACGRCGNQGYHTIDGCRLAVDEGRRGLHRRYKACTP
jgi:hypothetical protein